MTLSFHLTKRPSKNWGRGKAKPKGGKLVKQKQFLKKKKSGPEGPRP
jgi:hypothetical protein